ncbi:ABC transporter permease [Salinicola tamaricis]|uniref:ABC transporter permease n=1 Tax=Salinicola tamaricis TaxID=1771309 RepID=UPI001F5DBCB9|nr:ABC transporter permease [Salinicola tamaricis]
MIVVAVSAVVFAAAIGPKFYSAFTLTLILQQVAITGIVSAGQTLIILTAGIDLSVGAIMVLSSVVMGQFAIHYGVPGFLAVIAGLAAGGLCGLINGLLVSRVKLPPFIVTLGTWSIFGAITFIYSGNETVRSQEIDQTAPILHVFGNAFHIGHAVFTYGGVILMLVISALLWYALNKTAWGRHVYAVGDDKQAAMLAGIRTGRVLVSVYVVTGLICALAGWALIGRIGSVSPQAGQLENINAITAVVIGGTSLFGGRGSILGTLFGALIVGVFSLGLRLLGTDPQWTQLTVGALIIIAVATDQWIRRASA